jgi:mRNA-degrading endonuclease toxin of MazEF toxin-antitoxin module
MRSREPGGLLVLAVVGVAAAGTVYAVASPVAPTSASARPATFRPAVDVQGDETRVLVEQTTVIDPQRLGSSAGRLDSDELRAVDEALGLVHGL